MALPLSAERGHPAFAAPILGGLRRPRKI